MRLASIVKLKMRSTMVVKSKVKSEMRLTSVAELEMRLIFEFDNCGQVRGEVNFQGQV